MKKIIRICIIIIILGLIANIGLYFYKSKNTSVENKNISQNTKNQVKSQNNNDTNKGNGYYSIERTSLDRPIGYMFDNIDEALPQSGVYGADYVYEMMVEGGLTRLLAIYTRGDIDKIGPVRSSRHNFLDISMEYDAIYCHFGGSPKAFEDIEALKIPSLNGIKLDGSMYWRDKTRKAPHNSYTSIQKTLEFAKKYNYDKVVPVNHFGFSESDYNLDGENANNILIPYSYSQNTSYIYDSTTKLYNRFMKGKPHMDSLINKQLSAKNIIIEFAEYNSIDDLNRQDIKLVGSGKGYFITNGKYIQISWKKNSRSDKTIFYDQAGNEIKLNKGQTWTQIVPLNAKVSIK